MLLPYPRPAYNACFDPSERLLTVSFTSEKLTESVCENAFIGNKSTVRQNVATKIYFMNSLIIKNINDYLPPRFPAPPGLPMPLGIPEPDCLIIEGGLAPRALLMSGLAPLTCLTD
jgi:hypothetical protein